MITKVENRSLRIDHLLFNPNQLFIYMQTVNLFTSWKANATTDPKYKDNAKSIQLERKYGN